MVSFFPRDVLGEILNLTESVSEGFPTYSLKVFRCESPHMQSCNGRFYSIIGKKNNQSSVSDADREIPTLESTDNAGNSVKFVSGIIRLPLGLNFSVCIGDR